MSTAFHERHRLISVDEFNKMADVGIFAPDERVELIDGFVMAVPRISSLRASVITRMRYQFGDALGQRALVAVRPTVIVSDRCEPEPDLGVFTWKTDFYSSATPRPSDVLALIETTDAEPAFCRDRKLPAYSKADIAECWIVDLVSMRIEIYLQNGCGRFGAPTIRSEGEMIALSAFPEVMFTVDELLG